MFVRHVIVFMNIVFMNMFVRHAIVLMFRLNGIKMLDFSCIATFAGTTFLRLNTSNRRKSANCVVHHAVVDQLTQHYEMTDSAVAVE